MTGLPSFKISRGASLVRAAFLSAAVAVIAAPALLAADALEVSFQPRGAVVTGVTPGGSLVVFARAVGRVGRVYNETVAVDLIVTDRLRAGRITIDCGRELPPDAVWTVVDLTTGRHAIVARGAAGGAAGVQPDDVKYTAGDGGKLRLQRRLANVLVVRPGDGAWSGAFADGAATDEDARMNGAATIAPGKLKHLDRRSNRALGQLRKGDLVFILDPKTLRVWTSSEIGE
jgi:hypothetical protein